MAVRACQRGRWSFGEVAFVASPALLGVSELSDLHDVAALVYLTEATALAVRLGTTAAQLKAWSALDLAQVDAANAKQTAPRPLHAGAVVHGRAVPARHPTRARTATP